MVGTRGLYRTYSLNQVHLSFVVMSEQHIIGLHTKDLHCNYSDWISAWNSHLQNQSVSVKVPSTATAVTSPLNVRNWQEALLHHPNRPLVDFFLSGFLQGFCIGFKQRQNSLKSAKRNLSCALQHPEICQCINILCHCINVISPL